MKRILLASVFVITGMSVQAQSAWYDLQPNDTLYGVAPFDNLTIFDIYQYNNQSDTIILKWFKISEDMPVGWEKSLCDLGSCYPGLPNSGTMFPVSPGDSGFLGWNVIPNQVPGIGVVRYYVYEENHLAEGDTLTWIISTPDFNSVNDLVVNNLSIYPTPASDVVTVNSHEPLTQIEVFSVAGQLLQNVKTNGATHTLDVSQLVAGTYLMQIHTASGAVQNKRLTISR